MRINLHVIVIGAGLTGSFFLKEMIAYLHMKQENLILSVCRIYTASMRMIWSRGIICMWRESWTRKPAVWSRS